MNRARRVLLIDDTPEIAESRRIVSESKNEQDSEWEKKKEWTTDEEEEPEW